MSDRVETLLGRLRRDEKLRLVQGRVDPEGRATGYVPPVERLGVPACTFTDGPLGVRYGRATAFPASVALAASFDPGLAERFGRALAAETRAKGFDGVLAPGLNLARVPHCGRLFEYFGEDPHLAARMAGRTVAGVESTGVLSSPKHYVANHQERGRLSVSADVDERALRELYLPAVEAAVDAGAGTVMAAYNRVNGVHATQHERLLTGVLKDEFGFDGVVVSDWWAVHDPAAAAAAGLDLEMPGATVRDLLTDDAGRPVGPRELLRRWPPYLPSGVEELLGLLAGSPAEGPGLGRILGRSTFAGVVGAAVDEGSVSEERLDDMVRRLLGQYERVGLLGDGDRPSGSLGTRAHRDLAREIAVRGTVLLKNDGVLPLADGVRVALVGPGADRPKTGGGGSSRVTPFRRTSPLAGLRDRVGADAVEFERGCARVGTPRSVRGLVGRAVGSDPALDDAVAAADRGDVAVVVVRDDAAEGRDRPSLGLPGDQDRLVRAVAATGTPTVVVLETGGPVETPWLDDVDAVVETWYGGQETGAAVAAAGEAVSALDRRLPWSLPGRDRLARRARRFGAAAERVAAGPPSQSAALLGLSAAAHVASVLALLFAFGAVDAPVAVDVLFAVVPTAVLAAAAPTPGAVGGVEVALGALLSAATGSPAAVVGAAVVIYRGSGYAFRLVLGGLAAAALVVLG